jgi:BASS family bile acid:Na+ symporter
MFILVLLSLGQNRENMFAEPGIVLLIALVCMIRVFVVSFILLYLLKKKNAGRDNSIIYVTMAVWKNSGLAVTLCFVLFGSASVAAVPCAISLLVEVLWFALISGYMEKVWPSNENAAAAPA